MAGITYENLQYIMEEIKKKKFSTYDSSLVYAIGDIAFYVDSLYECVVEISTPEEFDSDKWVKITLAEATKPNINTTNHTITI